MAAIAMRVVHFIEMVLETTSHMEALSAEATAKGSRPGVDVLVVEQMLSLPEGCRAVLEVALERFLVPMHPVMQDELRGTGEFLAAIGTLDLLAEMNGNLMRVEDVLLPEASATNLANKRLPVLMDVGMRLHVTESLKLFLCKMAPNQQQVNQVENSKKKCLLTTTGPLLFAHHKLSIDSVSCYPHGCTGFDNVNCFYSYDGPGSIHYWMLLLLFPASSSGLLCSRQQLQTRKTTFPPPHDHSVRDWPRECPPHYSIRCSRSSRSLAGLECYLRRTPPIAQSSPFHPPHLPFP